MRQTAIGFKSDVLSLEGVLATPDGPTAGRYPAVVVCHPHPMLGGDMDNPVVTAICRALDLRGIASLRFNFRGTGRSEGEFTNGPGEGNDAEAALETLSLWPGIDSARVGLAGYSFGATAILRGIAGFSAARCLALIAPPVSAVDGSDAARDKRPKLFISGENDRIAPPLELQRALDGFDASTQFFQVPGADHSLRGAENVVAEEVARFMAGALSAGDYG